MSKMGALRSGICFSPQCQVDTAQPSAAKNDRAGDVDENPRLFFDLRGDLAGYVGKAHREGPVRWNVNALNAGRSGISQTLTRQGLRRDTSELNVAAGEMPRPRTTDDWDVRRGSVA
jgi:hypothetical protein